MQRRTRLRIGSGGMLYLVVSVVIVGAAIYTQANLLFWGFGLMVGGLVFTVGMAAVALRGLEVTRLVPTHGAAGEALALRYRVHNRGMLPAFGLVIREGWGPRSRSWKKAGPACGPQRMLGGPPYAWIAHIGPGQTTQAQAPCRPLRRGRLNFERIEVSSSFPFGVIYKSILLPQADEVRVFPQLYRVQRRLLSSLPSTDGDGSRPVSRVGGYGEFYGLREYRPGDSPRTIDWKRTARSGTLVSRELTTPRPPRLMILLDLREPPPMGIGTSRFAKPQRRREDASGGSGGSGASGGFGGGSAGLEERAISLTASLICEGYLRGLRVGLRVMGPHCASFPPRHSLPQRTRMLEALAELDLSRREPLQVESGLPGRVDVVVWAGRGTGLPPRPGLSGSGSGAARAAAGPGAAVVLGAVDFDEYVTNAAALAELNAMSRGVTAAGGANSGSHERRQPMAGAEIRGQAQVTP